MPAVGYRIAAARRGRPPEDPSYVGLRRTLLVAIVEPMRSLLAVIVLAGALTAAAGDASGQTRRGDAAPFLSRVVRLIAANDYEAAYPLLHPGQRRLVSAAEYVSCEQMSPIPGRLTSLRVLETKRERIHVAGTKARRVASTAVTFELRLVGTLPGEATTVDLTAHAVSVAGRWAWILSARRLALHRSGTCGVVAP